MLVSFDEPSPGYNLLPVPVFFVNAPKFIRIGTLARSWSVIAM